MEIFTDETTCGVVTVESLFHNKNDRNSFPDPKNFLGPPGSGSVCQRFGSGSASFHHQAKIVRKIWIFTFL
jgi:hypothetical protein